MHVLVLLGTDFLHLWTVCEGQ